MRRARNATRHAACHLVARPGPTGHGDPDLARLLQVFLPGEHHQLLHFLPDAALPHGAQTAQVYLFVFLAAAAAGTVIGGPIGDKFGRKAVIWGSIVGVVPFTLALPYASLPATIVLSVIIGIVLSSAFSAIIVYAQELMPGRVGMVSGLFFGLAFGMGGIGAAALGVLADRTSITWSTASAPFCPSSGCSPPFFPTFVLPPRRRHKREGSGSFLKKRTKKLLLLWPLRVASASPHALAEN